MIYFVRIPLVLSTISLASTANSVFGLQYTFVLIKNAYIFLVSYNRSAMGRKGYYANFFVWLGRTSFSQSKMELLDEWHFIVSSKLCGLLVAFTFILLMLLEASSKGSFLRTSECTCSKRCRYSI